MDSASKEQGKGSVVAIHGLRITAKAVATTYGDDGAIVITMGKDGVRIGTEGLTPQQMQDALCLAIHYNFCFSEKTPT